MNDEGKDRTDCEHTHIDDLAWWHHQMETFSVLLALCVGKSPVTGEFLSQRPVTRSFDIFWSAPE